MDGSNRRIVTEMIRVRRKDKIDGVTFRNESGPKHFSTLTKADSFERVSDPEAYKDFAFTLKGMKRINYIRSVDPMAYAYLVKALQLLQPQGFFTDSIL